MPIQTIGKRYAGRVGGYGRIFGVKNISFLVETFFFYQKIGLHPLSLSFVKLFGLISETFVRGTVGLILVKKDFNYFNFYSILVEMHMPHACV